MNCSYSFIGGLLLIQSFAEVFSMNRKEVRCRWESLILKEGSEEENVMQLVMLVMRIKISDRSPIQRWMMRQQLGPRAER